MRGKNSSPPAKAVDSQIWVNAKLSKFPVMDKKSKNENFVQPFPSSLEIGQRIRAARKNRGWTIADMATAGKMNAVVIGSYERGSRNMPLSRLGEIASTLGVDVSYLLGQPINHSVNPSSSTIDLRALSRKSATHPDWQSVLVKYCAGIVKMRNDWNGEVLSIRQNDLINLGFSIGINQPELVNWLSTENYLLREIDQL
jgi:transcriptional regulator with XRE-family HTH domain